MRIVFDSNVLIAAFATHVVCHLLFEASLALHEIQLSDFILGEVTEKLKLKIKLPETIIIEITAYLKEHCQQQISRDPDDDAVLMLAEETDSTYIVTGDKDLLVLETYHTIKIVSPREFADILQN